MNELNVWGSITLHKLFTWIYYTENVYNLEKIDIEINNELFNKLGI